MKKIAFLIDPIESLNPNKDSTLYLMNASLKKGFSTYWADINTVKTRKNLVSAQFINYSTQMITDQSFNDFDIIFLREEPPINDDFYQLTYLYELAKHPVYINPISVLRDISEKLYPLNFPNFIPDQIITRKVDDILFFLKEKKEIILKPVGLFGSQGVFKVSLDTPNYEEIIIDNLIKRNDLFVIQEFLSNVSKGDKRIFIVRNEILGSFISKPARNDFRGSSVYGATFEPSEITTKENKICQQLMEQFKKDHIIFAGVDMVDEKITEINVTCVGGIWNMNSVYKIEFESVLFDKLIHPYL